MPHSPHEHGDQRLVHIIGAQQAICKIDGLTGATFAEAAKQAEPPGGPSLATRCHMTRRHCDRLDQHRSAPDVDVAMSEPADTGPDTRGPTRVGS